MTKRDIVRRSIAHQHQGITPYCIQFTPEAEAKVKTYYECQDVGKAIGNYVYPVTPPWWDWYGIEPSGVDKLYGAPDPPPSLPRSRGTGCYEEFEERIREIKETTGCYVLVLVYGSYFEKAQSARGIENTLADMAGNKGYFKRLLDHIARKNLVMLENILANDEIDGVLVGGDWGSQRAPLMSPDAWRELIAPSEKQEYDLIHSAGKHVWIHSCGNIAALIPDLIDLGVDVLNPLQPECMDIGELKRLHGDMLTFWGGIRTQDILAFGTPNEVVEEVRKVDGLMGKGGGYIAAPGQYVQGDVPLDNVIALIDEVRAFASIDHDRLGDGLATI